MQRKRFTHSEEPEAEREGTHGGDKYALAATARRHMSASSGPMHVFRGQECASGHVICDKRVSSDGGGALARMRDTWNRLPSSSRLLYWSRVLVVTTVAWLVMEARGGGRWGG